jgi:hypothetical protein
MRAAILATQVRIGSKLRADRRRDGLCTDVDAEVVDGTLDAVTASMAKYWVTETQQGVPTSVSNCTAVTVT